MDQMGIVMQRTDDELRDNYFPGWWIYDGRRFVLDTDKPLYRAVVGRGEGDLVRRIKPECMRLEIVESE